MVNGDLALRLGWLALILPALLGAAPSNSVPHDWPNWRGPQHDGHSAETGLARQWPEGGPPLAWRVSGLGVGYSAPAVVGRRVLVMGNRDGQEWLMALDRQRQGQVLWQTPLGPVRHDGAGYPGPRSTPTCDGSRVYTLGLNGDLIAADLETGQIVWRHDLVGEFGGGIPTWGYSESVLVDGPWLLCTPGGATATVLALDKKYGQTIWAAPIGDGAGYSSIVKATFDGVPQYVQFTAQGVIGVEAATGKLLWRYDKPANGTANISTPLVSGADVFAASGYGTGGGLARIGRSGAELAATEVYFTKNMKNHHGGLILDQGVIYGSNDPGLLTCMDWATGDVLWKSRDPGKSSLVLVDGMLIARSEEGRVSLVEATREAFRLLGQFEQPDRSPQPSWPHPVVADGQLYLRDQDLLLVYQLRP